MWHRIGRRVPRLHVWPMACMVRLAYTLTGDQGHAEDITQAAFASAYASWRRVRQAGDPDAYVRAIVIHENSKRFRKQRVREDPRAAVPEQIASSSTETCSPRRRPTERSPPARSRSADQGQAASPGPRPGHSPRN
jgi:DNA-directed RNA polymerase specialized sigma24 family protein